MRNKTEIINSVKNFFQDEIKKVNLKLRGEEVTDNQIELLVDVINKSSFKDDLWVAIVSGGIILVTTTLITFIISRHESKKAKEEIKNRIELETLENLKAKRLFYVEQIEMTDLLNLENDIDSLHQIILDVYDKARMNDSFFGKGLVEKKKLGAMYLKEIPKLIKSISQRVKQYNFSEQEQGVIFQYIGMADSLRH